MATVLKIPAKFHPITHLPETKVQKRRVAAYARVSTDSEEQQTSYAAQVDRYTKYIQERADWEFVAVYTDEGISALNTKHRDGFNRMVADALDGKIDLIVTKSVSRFARNTVDSLTTVRKLKEKGVDANMEQIKQDIALRDQKDSQREVSPLVQAPDAELIDTSNLSFDEVVEKLFDKIEK